MKCDFVESSKTANSINKFYIQKIYQFSYRKDPVYCNTQFHFIQKH